MFVQPFSQLTMELALIGAELDVADAKTRKSDRIVNDLNCAVAECQKHLDNCILKKLDQRIVVDREMAEHRQILEK